MAKKVYAVRKGHRPGLYMTWDECQAQVSGFSGAEFKSFKSHEEAAVWLGAGNDAAEAPAGAVPASPKAAATAPSWVEDRAFQEKDGDDLPPWVLDPVEVPRLKQVRAEGEPSVETAASPEAETASAEDLRKKRKAKAQAFLAFLQQHGIPVYAVEGNSEHCERLGIEGGGYIDLYLTRNKPYTLHFVHVDDSERRRQIERLWRVFHWDVGGRSEAGTTGWEVVEHYYSVLKPYAHLNFDFFALARALELLSDAAPPAEEVRYDFPRIEAAYQRLRPHRHE